jgi:threonyl-tRNA synthetase
MPEIKEQQNNEAGQRLEASPRLATIRHSVSHIMAQAVTRLFPGTKVAIGPMWRTPGRYTPGLSSS